MSSFFTFIVHTYTLLKGLHIKAVGYGALTRACVARYEWALIHCCFYHLRIPPFCMLKIYGYIRKGRMIHSNRTWSSSN